MFHGAMNRGADVQIDLTISFEESVFGVSKRVRIPYRRKGSETIEIPVPAGIDSGARLHLTGRGEPSKDGKAPSGDLYIRVLVQEHPIFHRQGGDIVCKIDLTPAEALLGVEKEIRGLRDEKLAVYVPERSVEGTQIIFQDKGIPRPSGTGRLIVLCHIVYPNSMSRKVRELLTDLQKEGW